MRYKIFSLCETAVTIDFGNEISVEINEKVISLADYFEKNPFSGLIETVSAYSSLTIFFDLLTVRKNFPQHQNAFSAIKVLIENAIENPGMSKQTKARLVKIPVDYSRQFAPDLEIVAQKANLSIQEVIKIHTSQTYRVFMIGFLPAFAYMGEVDKRIATPRKQTPRTKITKGSVGIAGNQTGIYPMESPGGWQIIGKTTLEIFQPQNKRISLLKTGDSVRFYDINQK